jgi:hypothetical protein
MPSVVCTVRAFWVGTSPVMMPPKLKKLVAPQVSMSAVSENHSWYVAPLTLPIHSLLSNHAICLPLVKRALSSRAVATPPEILKASVSTPFVATKYSVGICPLEGVVVPRRDRQAVGAVGPHAGGVVVDLVPGDDDLMVRVSRRS